MYMHISSTTSLRRGRSIDCYLNDCCCNHFLQRQTPTSTGIHSFSPCLKVSCGLRQSALICSSRYRRVVGNNGCHIQKKRAGVIYPGQDRICRCLGWGEEKEEEEEEEACIGGLQGYEPTGEVQEMLSFLIEDRRRRAQGSKRMEILRSSEVSGTVSGLGVVWKEKSCYAKRAIGERIGKQTSCSAEKENAGKGCEQLEFEDKWDKFTGFAQKKNVKKESLCEKGTCQKSCLDTSMNGWKNRLNWISALESKNRRLNWICALEMEKQEGSFENGAERTALGKRWNQLDSCVRWSSTVYPEKREETIKKSTEKFGSDTSLNSSSRFTKLLQETVGNETEKIGPRKMLDSLRRNVQWISAVKFQKQEETVQESTQKSGFELPSNNSKNMRQVSMTHSGEDETSSLEKGQSSGVGLGLGEHSREHLDQMVRQETVENTTEKLVFKPDKLDLMEQTLQKERGKLVSSLSSDHSRNTARWSSDPEFAKRETVENTTKTLVFRQQDELDSRKKSAQILQKERGELAPGMLSNYSSEIAGLSSLTKLKEQERVESTTKKLVFPQQDDFISKNGRSSSAKLEEERGTTEENAKTASERSGFLAISNSNSQKVFKESSHISGSSNVLSSGIELDEKISNVDYEKGNKTSQRLFKTSSSKPVYGEASALVAEKNKSTTSSGKADNTSENMLQTSSYTLVHNGILSAATEVEKIRSTSDHKTSSKIFQFSGDLRSKSSSNEILGMTTELEKKKYTTDTNTQAMFGKSASGKLSDESERSLEMFSAEGTENHGLNEKNSEESPPQSHDSQLLSGNFAAGGPSEEVWAIAGCSSREESKELHSSGNEKEERGSETLTSEEPSGTICKKNIAGLEEGNSTASKSDGKIIVGRHSRGLWSSIAELCSKGWSSHVDSENSTMKSGSGRPSTESPDSEEWFSVPELEDEEYTSKEKKGKDKKKISAKRQVDAVISSTGPSKTVDLKETESPQAKKADKPIKKSTSESSLDYSQLTRRRVSSAGNGHERQIRGKGGRLVAIADTKKTEGTKQVEMQKAAIQWVSEGSLEDELAVSIGRVPSGSHEEHDCLERGKGEISLVNKDEIEEHDDIQELVQSSEIEEKEKITSKLKLTNQVPKETFILWEEALILQSEQRQEDEKFMREALSEARMAADAWEVPVGAVLVQNGRIIARAHNLVEENRDATAHAEMLCIRYASNQLKTWRLAESTLYVTLEPCAMCAGAILQARIGTVVWGAPNKLLGADGSWISLFPRADEERLHGTDGGPPSTAPVHPFHPNIRVRRGVLASECSNVMQQFFKLRRKSEKKPESHSRFSLTNCQSKLFAKLHDMFSIFCL